MRLAEDTAYADFTERFRRHFRDVTEALAPRPLVLFVDDLDRCTPEHAMATLETVNRARRTLRKAFRAMNPAMVMRRQSPLSPGEDSGFRSRRPWDRG